MADFSDNQCVTCFQDSAEPIPGTPADELGDLKDTVRLHFIKSKNK